MKKKFGNIEITLDEKRIQKKIEDAARKKYENGIPYVSENATGEKFYQPQRPKFYERPSK